MSVESDLLPLLTVTNGPLRGASFRLRPGLRRIGREDGVDVLLDDPKVSRRHATVELVDGRVLLADTGSTNGTWLNDERLAGHTELRDGDRIRLGHVELRFFDPGAAVTDQLSTLGRLPPPLTAPTAVGALAAPPGAGALAVPTQLMGTSSRLFRPSGRMLLVIAAGVTLAAWAYVALL